MDPEKRFSTNKALQHRWMADPEVKARAESLMHPPVVSDPMPPPATIPVSDFRFVGYLKLSL